MSYSCSDFTDDVLAAFIKRGLFEETSIEDDDPEQQAQLVIGTLDDVLKQFKELEARATSKSRRRVVPVLPTLTRRHVLGPVRAQAAATYAIACSAYVEVTPLPDDRYEIAVKVDRASVLPIANGTTCIDPDAKGAS